MHPRSLASLGLKYVRSGEQGGSPQRLSSWDHLFIMARRHLRRQPTSLPLSSGARLTRRPVLVCPT